MKEEEKKTEFRRTLKTTPAGTLVKIRFKDPLRGGTEETLTGTVREYDSFHRYATIGHPISGEGKTPACEWGMRAVGLDDVEEVLPVTEGDAKKWARSYAEFHKSVLKTKKFDSCEENPAGIRMFIGAPFRPEEDPLNGYDAVDLGLPTGTLWSPDNLGNYAPRGDGKYYQYLITEGFGSGEGVPPNLCKEREERLGKPELLGDPASREMRSGWRLPTADELRELCEGCDIEFDPAGNRARLTSKSNGTVLTIPAAGAYNDNGFYNEGSGTAWLASSTPNGERDALCLQIHPNSKWEIATAPKWLAMPARGVHAPAE